MIIQAIDDALKSLANRELFSHQEVLDMLLDLRSLADEDKEITVDDFSGTPTNTENV